MDQNKEVEEVKSEVVGAEPEKPGSMAIAAMIVGIVSILCCAVPFLNVIMGAVAVVLGILGLKNVKAKTASSSGKVMAIVGIVLGGVSVIGGIIWIITLGAGYFFTMARSYQNWY